MSAGRLELEEVRAAIALDQPKMRVTRDGSNIVVRGSFLLVEDANFPNPAGPISEFEIKIIIGDKYPEQEPKVFEVGGRIPIGGDRHVNVTGDCCVTVWEAWLIRAKDTSIAAFLKGPVREYFLGQYMVERKKDWPFGEYRHYEEGLVEAYTEALGIPSKKNVLRKYLRLLAKPWPKNHYSCPCGSRKSLRDCHKDDLKALHVKVPPHMARRMLGRLKNPNK